MPSSGTVRLVRPAVAPVSFTSLATAPAIDEYFSAPVSTGNQSAQGSNNVVSLMPLIIPIDMTVDRIACNCDTAAASSFFRLGVYRADASGRPGTLLLDAGQVDTSSTGNKEIVIRLRLPAGRVWLAIVPQGGSSRFRASTSIGGPATNVTTAFNNLFAPNVQLVGSSGITAELPPTLTISYTSAGTNPLPIIALRRAA